jgi:hypothetical protein
MIPSWPSELPRPFRDAWQAQQADPRRKRASDAGPPRYARRFSAVPETIALRVALDRHQKSVFDQFIEQTLKHGSMPFYMPDFTTDGWPLHDEEGTQLLDENDVPLLVSAQMLCLLGDGMPVETLTGMTFFKSFTVVRLP